VTGTEKLKVNETNSFVGFCHPIAFSMALANGSELVPLIQTRMKFRHLLYFTTSPVHYGLT
jgi:hypothetical protein